MNSEVSHRVCVLITQQEVSHREFRGGAMWRFLLGASAASLIMLVHKWISHRSPATRAFTLHRAWPGDRAALVQLVVSNHLKLSAGCPEEWMEQLCDVPRDFAHLLDALQFVRGRYNVAKEVGTGRVVGAAGVTPIETKDECRCEFGASNHDWALTAVTVADEWRRQGVAASLVRMALQDARDAGARCVKAVTLKELMQPAWRLYERLGFQLEATELVAQRPRHMTVLSYKLHL